MPPKKKKPEAQESHGIEVVSVSQVEAGVNSHANIPGSGKSGSNVTEKDKVEFLCLLKQMTVSSEGIGNHTNSGIGSDQLAGSPNTSNSYSDLGQWSQQAAAPKQDTSTRVSPPWEYLDYLNILKESKEKQNAINHETKISWPETNPVNPGDTAVSTTAEQIVQHLFSKQAQAMSQQEMSWPAPPHQTKLVRPPLPHPQLPLPNFPQPQQQQLPLTPGLLPQPTSPFGKLPLPQPQLVGQPHLPQHQFPQQLLHTPVGSPGLIANPVQGALPQSNMFLASHGMAQLWQPLQGQVPTNPLSPVTLSQPTIRLNTKQPFMPVAGQPGILQAQQKLQQLQYPPMQPAFISGKLPIGGEQTWQSKEQLPNNQSFQNIQTAQPLAHDKAPLLPQSLGDASKGKLDAAVGPKQTRKNEAQRNQPANKPSLAAEKPGEPQKHSSATQQSRGARDRLPENSQSAILTVAHNFIDMRRNEAYCVPCEKRMPVDNVEEHIMKSEYHKDMVQEFLMGMTSDFCFNMVLHSERDHILSKFLTDEVERLRISDVQKLQVTSVVNRLQSIAENVTKVCRVRLYGSLASGIALAEDLELNVDLETINLPKEQMPEMFIKFIEILKTDPLFKNVRQTQEDSFPCVAFIDVTTNLPVRLTLNNHSSFKLSRLLLNYAKLDERVAQLTMLFRAWGRLCQLDKSEDGGWSPHAFPILVIHFLQRIKMIPVLHEEAKFRTTDPDYYADAESVLSRWQPKPGSLGTLWIRLLYFYYVQHDKMKQVVTITQSRPHWRIDTKWRAVRRIAIIDPFQPKRNVASQVSNVMSNFIEFCLVSTILYFTIPQTPDGPLFGYVRRLPNNIDDVIEFSGVYSLVTQLVLTTKYYNNNNPKSAEHRAKLRKHLQSLPMFQEMLEVEKRAKVTLFPTIVHEELEAKADAFANWQVSGRQARDLCGAFRADLTHFAFSKDKFIEGANAPIWCTSCQSSGHRRQDCPDEVIPPLGPLPALSPSDIDVLNTLCDDVCKKWGASDDETNARESMTSELNRFIGEKYRDAELTIFGSSSNGFGSRQSDVDLCLTFASRPDGDIDYSRMIYNIASLLSDHKGVSDVNPVSMAKVPIVKFTWNNNVQVDLSLYNRLGQENTKLLKAYSEIDPRVRPLVYMMKRFVKTASIGDASRGSLSSYAYTLMVLYFLQQTDPPILPVLQEISEDGEAPPVVLVENANVYFFNDLKRLESVWRHKKNPKSVGELWLDILEFYGSPDFQELSRVISIRQKQPLYKSIKLWSSMNLCIEDPFDLAHNLGSGLSRRMNAHILKTFQMARRHFGTAVCQRPPSIEDHFFDASVLMPGKPPCDRGCRHCGHIGHNRDECPERRRAADDQRKKKQANGVDRNKKSHANANTRNGQAGDKRQEQSPEKTAEIPADKKQGRPNEKSSPKARQDPKRGGAGPVEKQGAEAAKSNVAPPKEASKHSETKASKSHNNEDRTDKAPAAASSDKPTSATKPENWRLHCTGEPPERGYGPKANKTTNANAQAKGREAAPMKKSETEKNAPGEDGQPARASRKARLRRSKTTDSSPSPPDARSKKFPPQKKSEKEKGALAEGSRPAQASRKPPRLRRSKTTESSSPPNEPFVLSSGRPEQVKPASNKKTEPTGSLNVSDNVEA